MYVQDEIMCYAQSSEALIPLLIDSRVLNEMKQVYMEGTSCNYTLSGIIIFQCCIG